MLVYRVTGDIKAIEAQLTGLARAELPFAAETALNATAKFVMQKLREEMPRVFDRPTKATLDSLFVLRATKKELRSEVRVKDQTSGARDAANKWLAAEITGGVRRLKAFERLLLHSGKMPPGHFLVPGKGMPLDAYGNVSRGEITRLLSDLSSQFDPQQNISAASKKRRLARRSKRAMFYFSTWPPNTRTRHLSPGIYRRMHFGFGTAIVPAFLFVKSVRYRPRLHFYEIANRIAPMRWRIEFPLAMRKALETSRRKGLRYAA